MIHNDLSIFEAVQSFWLLWLWRIDHFPISDPIESKGFGFFIWQNYPSEKAGDDVSCSFFLKYDFEDQSNWFLWNVKDRCLFISCDNLLIYPLWHCRWPFFLNHILLWNQSHQIQTFLGKWRGKNSYNSCRDNNIKTWLENMEICYFTPYIWVGACTLLSICSFY